MGGSSGHVVERRTGTRVFETLFALAAAGFAIGGLWYALRHQQPQTLFMVAPITLFLAAIAVLPEIARTLRSRG